MPGCAKRPVHPATSKPFNVGDLVATHLKLQLIAPPLKLAGFDVTMAWHTRFDRDPAVAWLRGVFVQLFAQR